MPFHERFFDNIRSSPSVTGGYSPADGTIPPRLTALARDPALDWLALMTSDWMIVVVASALPAVAGQTVVRRSA